MTPHCVSTKTATMRVTKQYAATRGGNGAPNAVSAATGPIAMKPTMAAMATRDWMAGAVWLTGCGARVDVRGCRSITGRMVGLDRVSRRRTDRTIG